MTDDAGPLLYDVDYVKNCLQKVIEEKPPGYAHPELDENEYFRLEWEGGNVAYPSCLIGHVLGQLGVTEHTALRMAMEDDTFNNDCIADLVRKLRLPVTEEALELLTVAQKHSDNKRPWDTLFQTVA